VVGTIAAGESKDVIVQVAGYDTNNRTQSGSTAAPPPTWPPTW